MENVSNYQRLELYEDYLAQQNNNNLQQGLAGNGAADKDKGVTLQQGQEGTPEGQAARANANADQIAQMTALKGESAEFIQQAVTQSGKDKSFSDNKKAQNTVEEQIYRELIARDAANPESDLAKLNKRWAEAKTDAEKQAILQEKEAVFAAIRKEAELRTEALRMTDEIKGMKDYAATHKKDEVGIGNNLTLTAQDDISSDKGTLYAEQDNLRDQILQEYMNVETIPSLDELTKKYGDENIAKAVLGVLIDNEYRKTHYEVHDAYLDKDAYNAAKEKAVAAGVSESTFEEHNTLVENKDVKAYIQKNFTNEKGEVDMQKLKDFVFQYIGSDFEVNYGVHKKHKGGHGQDEYRQLMEVTGLSRSEVQKLVIAAGGFTEKSDKATKILLAGLTGALAGAGLGAGGGAIAGSLLNVTANATATAIANATANVVDASGNVIQSATASDVQTATASQSANAAGLAVLPGALTGAAIGAIIGMGSAAIFYHYDGQRDVMNGYEVAQAVGDPEKMLKGLKNPTDLDKVPYNMITALKELGIPDVEIVNAIKVAKGNATGTHVTIEELISACRMLEVKYSKEPEKVEGPVPPQPQPKEYTSEIFEHTKEIQVAEKFYLRHLSGLYATTIATKGYTLEDGQALSRTQIAELASTINSWDNNVVTKNGKTVVTDSWSLKLTHTLNDGTVVVLKPEADLLKITPDISAPNANISAGKRTAQNVTYKTVVTPDGASFKIYEVKSDGSQGDMVAQSSTKYATRQQAIDAADAKIRDLKAADANGQK